MKTAVALFAVLSCPALTYGELLQITLEGNLIDNGVFPAGTYPEAGNPWFSDFTGDGFADIALSPMEISEGDNVMDFFFGTRFTIEGTVIDTSFDMEVVFNTGFDGNEQAESDSTAVPVSFTPPGVGAPVAGLLEITVAPTSGGAAEARTITFTRLVWDDASIITALPAETPTLFGTTREENDESIFTLAPVVIPGVVTTSADSGPGSLRSQIAAAESGATITFAVPEVILTSASLFVGKELTLDGGAFPQTVTIRREASAPEFGLITGNGGTSFRHLTLTGGNSGGVGGIGGAISFSGSTSVIIQSCLIHNNSASGEGGAIYTSGPPIVLDQTSIIYNNGGNGGGIACQSGASITATNSTISHNTATFTGGAVWLNETSTLEFTHCSILDNSVGNTRGGAAGDSQNTSANSITLRNCLFGRNFAAGILDGFAAPDGAFQVSSTTTQNAPFNESGILPIADPQFSLGGPAFGFPIFAHEILPIATAVIDQADPAFGLSTDQRGFPRITTATDVNGDPEDIGAIEYQQNRYLLFALNSFGSATVADELLRSSIWGPSADPDGDGKPNLTEFIFVTSPAFPTGSLIEVGFEESDGQSYPTITYLENPELDAIGLRTFAQLLDPATDTWNETDLIELRRASAGRSFRVTARTSLTTSELGDAAILRLAVE